MILYQQIMSRLCLALLSALVICLAGCQIEERELLSWQNDDNGHLKISSYVIDTMRLAESRQKGIKILIEGRHFDDILSIYKHLEKKEPQEAVEAEIAFFVGECLAFLDEALGEKGSPEQNTIAAELAYFLLDLPQAKTMLKERADLLAKLTRWSINYLRTDREVILPSPRRGTSTVNTPYVTPSDILLSLLHVTNPNDPTKPFPVFEIIQKDLAENISKTEYVLKVHAVVRDLRDSRVTEEMAKALMATARKTYPEGISVELVEAMIENQNKTLLKFLIEICRDRRVSYDALFIGLNKAADRAFDLDLQAEMLPMVRRVLASTNAFSKLTFRALRWAWEFGTEDDLRETLLSINPKFSAPVSGTDMKKEVDNFCGEFVKTKKDKVRKPLLDLLEELKDKPDMWPARLTQWLVLMNSSPMTFLR